MLCSLRLFLTVVRPAAVGDHASQRVKLHVCDGLCVLGSELTDEKAGGGARMPDLPDEVLIAGTQIHHGYLCTASDTAWSRIPTCESGERFAL